MQAEAKALGFDACGVADADATEKAARGLRAHLAAGFHGEMAWMAREPARREHPRELWPEVRSVVMVGLNHAPPFDPLMLIERPRQATIATYALRRDYHDVIKPRLKALARHMIDIGGGDAKVFVDTAPVMEKPLAEAAGLGWQGKHTVLISRDFGNWLFLGALYTSLSLPPDAPEPERCGSCRRCLDICPTNAFPAPHQLDARRCIAYLTIEHKGPIERAVRGKIGNRVFGCDDCLAVCPWNKFAQDAHDMRIGFREDLAHLDLAALAALDDAGFRALFAGTPIKRLGRERFLRNVLIAIGNSGQADLVSAARMRLADPSLLVRAMAVWALSRLLPAMHFAALALEHRGAEGEAEVISEWDAALKELGS